MENDLGDAIAIRELQVVDGDQLGSTVEIVLGRPRPLPNSQDYCVPYLIRSSDTKKFQYAVGVDAFQALQLALGILDAELSAFQRKHNLKLRWTGGKDGDLGFGEEHLRAL